MHIVNDLRNRFGTVRDQGPRPTCLAMSASDLHGCHHGAVTLSAEYLFYQGIRRMTSPDPQAGLTTGAVSAALISDGQPLEVVWPYRPALPEPWSPPEALGQIWKGEIRFRKETAKEVARILGTDMPLVLGLSLTTAFFNPDANGRLSVHQGDADTPHRHAVVGVGAARSPDGEDHVLVRNSWGANWGLNGHAWISVRYLEKRLLWIGSINGAAPNEAH